VAIAAVGIAGYAIYAMSDETYGPAGPLTTYTPEPVACAQDAMLCPNGSYVSRIAPKCEFAPCPEGTSSPTPSSNSTTINWKIYESDTDGFEIKYPTDWKTGNSDGSVYFMPMNGQDVAMSLHVFAKPTDEAEKLMPVFSVPGRTVDSRTHAIINGIDWTTLVVDKYQIIQLTYHEGKTYGAQYSTFENISPAILSTFKFIR
jgi:hypothetical protein